KSSRPAQQEHIIPGWTGNRLRGGLVNARRTIDFAAPVRDCFPCPVGYSQTDFIIFLSLPMRKFLFSALLLVTGASVAHSENLNLKFGPTWSCKMISAELEQRYQACLVCERQGKDFDPDAKEKCVDKVNPLSLRSKVEKAARGWAGLPDNETPDAATRLADQQARQREIDSETKQRATAEQERRRRESDVSGAGGSVSRNAE